MDLYEIRKTDNGWQVFVKENEEADTFDVVLDEETFKTKKEADAYAKERFFEAGPYKDKKTEADHDDDDDDDGDKKKAKSKKTEIEVKESLTDEDAQNFLKALDLDESHLEEIKTIFKASVNERVQAYKKQLDEAYQEKLDEEVAAIEEKMLDRVDSQLKKVVSEWTEENKPGIQDEVRAGLTESLVDEVFAVFSKYNIEVPSDKQDLYEKVSKDYNELIETYNSLVEESDGTINELQEELHNFKKVKVINEVAEGMSDASKERLALMVEDMEFVNEEKFTEKVSIIAEKLFGKKKPTLDEDETNDNPTLTENGIGVRNSEDNVSPVIAILKSGR